MVATAETLQTIADGRCWSSLAVIVDNEFFALLLTEPAALHDLLAAAPEEWLQENPRYLMARELAHSSTTRYGLGDDAVFKKFSKWVAETDGPATRDVLAVMQGRLRFFLAVGRFHDADTIANETLAAIAAATDVAGFVDVIPSILIRVGVTKLVTGDVESAIASFSDAVRWSKARGQHPIGRHAENYLALGLAVAGDITGAQKQLRHDPARAAAPLGTLAYLYETVGFLAAGMIALGGLDEEAAVAAIEGLSDFAETGELWWVASHLKARHALYWGDRETAIAGLEARLISHRGLGGPDALGGTVARADLADLYQAVGNYTAAEHVLKDTRANKGRSALLVARTRLELGLGEYNQALARLSSDDLIASGRDIVPAAVLTLQAAAHKHLGDDDSSRSNLEDAATHIRQTGALNMIAEAPREVRDELADMFGIDPGGLPVIYVTQAPVHLTGRERDVLEALRDHPTVKDLAVVLHISPNTAKTHLAALYQKLSVHTRDQALRVGPRPRP